MKTCKAILKISDDYKDHNVTCYCQRVEGHEGKHEETYLKANGNRVIIVWDINELKKESKGGGDNGKRK